MDNSNAKPPVYINWGDIPLSPIEQLLSDTRQYNHVIAQALRDGRMRDHPFNTEQDKHPISSAGDLGAWAVAIAAHASAPGTLPHTVPAPLTVQETAPVHAAGTDPTSTVVTPKRPRGRPRTFESKYPPGDPRRKAESVARSRAKRRAGAEAVFDITRVGLMVERGAGDHIAGSPLADLWFRITATNGALQKLINAARYEQDKLDKLCAEYEEQYPLGKVLK